MLGLLVRRPARWVHGRRLCRVPILTIGWLQLRWSIWCRWNVWCTHPLSLYWLEMLDRTQTAGPRNVKLTHVGSKVMWVVWTRMNRCHPLLLRYCAPGRRIWRILCRLGHRSWWWDLRRPVVTLETQ